MFRLNLYICKAIVRNFFIKNGNKLSHLDVVTCVLKLLEISYCKNIIKSKSENNGEMKVDI